MKGYTQMKKMFCLITLTIVMSMFVTSVYAETTDLPDLGFSSVEEMYNHAQRNGITNAEKAEIVLKDSLNNSISLDAYYLTSQNEDSTRETYVFAVPEEIISNDSLEDSIASSGSGSSSQYDTSYSVYGYITYYYSTKYAHGCTGYLLTSVTGGWQIVDSSVSITNREVTYACYGITLTDTGFGVNNSQYQTKYPTTNSFSYNSGFSEYVYKDGSVSTLGTSSEATLRHGGSSEWTLLVIAKKF